MIAVPVQSIARNVNVMNVISREQENCGKPAGSDLNERSSIASERNQEVNIGQKREGLLLETISFH